MYAALGRHEGGDTGTANQREQVGKIVIPAPNIGVRDSIGQKFGRHNGQYSDAARRAPC